MVPAEKKTQGIGAMKGASRELPRSQGGPIRFSRTAPRSVAAAAGAGDVVRGAEYGHQEFKSYADIDNPKEIADQGQQQGQQALGGGSLESGEHVPGSADQPQKQMDGVKQFGVLLGDAVLKGKIEKALEKAFSFGHVHGLQNMRCFRHIPS